MFFWNSCFSDDPMDVGIGPLVPLPFLNPSWTSGISLFTYCWSLAWRILGITLLVCEISATLWVFEHSLAFPFFVIRIQTALFQPCGHCWVFQICCHIECSTFIASSFKIWNSSTGIPSPEPHEQYEKNNNIMTQKCFKHYYYYSSDTGRFQPDHLVPGETL